MARRLPVLSVSQVETHQRCPRKRFIKSALRIKEAQAPAALVGDRVHEHSDKYLTDGTLPPGDDRVTYTTKYGQAVTKFPGAIFLNGRRFLPSPGTALSEGLFKMRSPAGIEWWGARDWVKRPIITGPESTVEGNPHRHHRGLLLGDNKTTSSPSYSKDYVDLLSDYQGNLYAHELLTNPHSTAYERLPDFGTWLPSEVPARWVYYMTDDAPNPPKKAWATPDQLRKWQSWVNAGRLASWAVDVTYYPDKVAKRVAEIDEIGLEIVAIQESTTDPMKVRANLDACEDYGGCAYRGTEHCKISTADVYGRAAERHTETQERLNPGTGPQGAPPVNVPAIAPAAPPVIDPITAALASAAAQRAAMAAQNPGAAVPPPVIAAPAVPPPVAVQAPAAPPPVAVQAAPAPAPTYPPVGHWQPGDQLDDLQGYLCHKGKTLLQIAMAHESRPAPREVAAGWPGADQIYTEELNQQIAAARAVATPSGQPEAGTINPPVGQGGVTEAARNPEEREVQYAADQATLPPAPGVTPITPMPTTEGEENDKALREATKAQCVNMGVKDPATGKVIDKSSRLGLKALRAALDAHVVAGLRAQAPAVEAPTAPPPVEAVAPAVQAPAPQAETPRELLARAFVAVAEALRSGAI